MVVKCDKCKNIVPEYNTRTYHLTLRTTNINNPLDKIVLCLHCDKNRRTNPLRYINL